MFENYVGSKQSSLNPLVMWGVSAAIALHVAAGAGLLIKSWWTIDEVERPKRQTAGFSTAPPPPPPPAGGSKKKIERKEKIKKVQEVTQIDERKDKPKVEDATDDNENEGEEGGVEGGVVGGVVGGVIGGVEGGIIGGVGTAAPPKVDEPKIVPQVALESQRLSGEKDIQPPNDVAVAIGRTGKQATGVVKMCLSESGSVSSLNMLKSTGHATYDAKLKSKMREWKYSPYKVNGKAIPVCTSVTFIYIPHK